MLTLGIGDSHDASVAAVRDGDILWSNNEERFSRVKLHAGFPEQALACCLADCGVSLRDVDRVCFGGYGPAYTEGDLDFDTPDLSFLRKVMALASKQHVLPLDGWFMRSLHQGVSKYGLRHAPARRKSVRRLRSLGYTGPIDMVDHHTAHAATAYYTSGFPEATVMTMDGGGDGLSGSIWHGRDGRLHRIGVMPKIHSPGNFWDYITHICGFSPMRHGGKITGLAAYTPCPRARDILLEFFGADTDRLTWVNRKRLFWHDAVAALRDALEGFSIEEIAWGAQKVLERNTSQIVSAAIGKTGAGCLAAAGGVFANVRLNQILHQLPEVEEIFIHPHMGDGGVGLGAALLDQARVKGSLTSVEFRSAFLGANIDDEAIPAQAEAAGLTARKLDHPEQYIAERLAKKQVVGLVQGRAEFGPRALCHRSILAEPTDTTMMEWLNERLDRTDFMPFAPVVIEEKAADYFQGYPRGRIASRFMTLCFDATDLARRKTPGVVHVDGTARPQVLSRQSDPLMHAVLCEYEKHTGFPVCINTSFNRHEEPIVNTARDAIVELAAGRVDALVINRYAVERPAAPD
jgi:carbamoyltransferase